MNPKIKQKYIDYCRFHKTTQSIMRSELALCIAEFPDGRRRNSPYRNWNQKDLNDLLELIDEGKTLE